MYVCVCVIHLMEKFEFNLQAAITLNYLRAFSFTLYIFQFNFKTFNVKGIPDLCVCKSLEKSVICMQFSMLFFLYDYYIYISFDQTVKVCNKVHHFTYFYKKHIISFILFFVEKIAFKTHISKININFSDKLLQNKFCSLILFCQFTYLYLFFYI